MTSHDGSLTIMKKTTDGFPNLGWWRLESTKKYLRKTKGVFIKEKQGLTY
jgi:hypothetical protein